MELIVKIKSNNDAFADGQADEVARILRKVTRAIEQGETSGSLLDFNGNKVGTFNLDPSMED